MRNKIIKFVVLGTVLVLTLSACNKTVVDKEVYIDSYINSIFNTTDTVESKRTPVYAVMHTAYSYSKLTSINVVGSLGKTIQLNNFSGTGFSFFTPVDSATYKPAVPPAETYTYNVLYDTGETVTKVDATVAKALMPARKLMATKTSTDIVLSWKAVANAEAYKIRILSQDGTTLENKLIYESDFLTPKDATSDLSIPFSLVSFSQYLNNNITFEVSAFAFELNQDTFHAVSATTIKRYFGI